MNDNRVVASWEHADTTVSEVIDALDGLRREARGMASRAAVVNLVVLAAVDAAADRVVGSVTGLGAHHPGRTTVIVTETDAAEGLGARLEVRQSEAEGRSVWWEMIVLHARGADLCRHLDSVVEPLLFHDLHLALWLAGGTSRVGSDALVAGADQLIVSGERAAAGRPDDLAGLAADLAGLSRRHPVADLAWLAIEPARQALAHLFDDPAVSAGTSGAAGRVELSGPPWSARLLASWLAERGVVGGSEWSGPGDDGRLRAVVDVPAGRVQLDAGAVWPAGPAGEASGPGVVEAWLDGTRVVVPHRGAGTARLLERALTRPGRDGRYDAALQQAARPRS